MILDPAPSPEEPPAEPRPAVLQAAEDIKVASQVPWERAKLAVALYEFFEMASWCQVHYLEARRRLAAEVQMAAASGERTTIQAVRLARLKMLKERFRG